MISVWYGYLGTGILKDNSTANVQMYKTIHNGSYSTYINMRHASVNNKVIEYNYAEVNANLQFMFFML